MLLIRKLIKKEKINIVHAHWLIPNAFIAVICRKIFKVDFKIISTIHGSDFLGFNNRIGNFFKKIALNNIDLLTVVSNALKDKVSEFGYKSDIYVYSMGLDTNLFSPAKRDNSLKDKLGIKGPFLLFVGIIVEQKGIRYLIKSMPKVIEVYPDAKLVIVGEGNLKNEMIEFADKLNVSNNLHFTGILPHDELPQYFATADLFILPSFSEGWPVVVMEALSSGTPTIVTNIPVFEKHEQKKRLFTIVPVGNSEFIAKEIIKMLTKKKILLSPQNDLRTYAKENLDWVIISNKYKNIIRICIEKK